MLLVSFAEKMRVEVINVAALFATDVALPRIGFRMTSFVEEVEGLVGEADAAERAVQGGGEGMTLERGALPEAGVRVNSSYRHCSTSALQVISQ